MGGYSELLTGHVYEPAPDAAAFHIKFNGIHFGRLKQLGHEGTPGMCERMLRAVMGFVLHKYRRLGDITT
jgi:hypothetical protein